MNEVKSSHFGKPHPVIEAGVAATGQKLASEPTVLSFVADIRKLRSVVDFGCGLASWLHAARRLGATEIRGYDIPELPLEARGLKSEEFFPMDLALFVELEKKFDLAICLEVAEHVPSDGARTLIRSLCSASDWVLFSAALPHQGGMGHINENWVEYWAALFAENSYLCYDILRMKFWHDTRIAHYYRQNTCLYVRPGAHYALAARGYKPSTRPPSLIHPELLLKHVSRLPGRHRIDADVQAFYRCAGRSNDASPRATMVVDERGDHVRPA